MLADLKRRKIGYTNPKSSSQALDVLLQEIGLPFGLNRFTAAVAEPVLMRTALALRPTRAETLRCIVWPAALPKIFSGPGIGFSLVPIGTLLGEMFGSQRGLGFLPTTAIGLQNVPAIMAVMLLRWTGGCTGGMSRPHIIILILDPQRRLLQFPRRGMRQFVHHQNLVRQPPFGDLALIHLQHRRWIDRVAGLGQYQQ